MSKQSRQHSRRHKNGGQFAPKDCAETDFHFTAPKAPEAPEEKIEPKPNGPDVGDGFAFSTPAPHVASNYVVMKAEDVERFQDLHFNCNVSVCAPSQRDTGNRVLILYGQQRIGKFFVYVHSYKGNNFTDMIDDIIEITAEVEEANRLHPFDDRLTTLPRMGAPRIAIDRLPDRRCKASTRAQPSVRRGR